MFIYRHPVDVLSSYRKRLQVEIQTIGEKAKSSWLGISWQDFATRYEHYVNTALSVQAQGRPNFMVLPYETLTREPEATIRKICSFVEVDFDPAMMPKKASKKRNHHTYTGGEIMAKTKNWSDYLPLEEAKLLEDRLAPLMEQLSYTRYS